VRAGSLSQAIWQRYREDAREAEILAVWERACSLLTSDGEIIGLVLPQAGNGPLNIVLHAKPDDLNNLQPGMPAQIDAHQMRAGDLIVSLEGAAVWDARPDWEGLRSRLGLCQQHLPALKRFASAHGTAGSLLDLLSDDQGPVHGQPNEHFPPTASDAVLTTVALALPGLRAAWGRDTESLPAAAAGLAGVGGGLTPAGDDFLCGAMMWIWMTRANAHPLCDRIAEAAAPRTTLLSAAFLQAGARGECSKAWHRLLDMLAKRTEEQLDRAVFGVLAHGATSGADTLAGFLWAALESQ
jgi:hypothetical protein